MAFNLNKNDESSSKVDLSKKSNSTSKFDLSKNDSSVVANEEKSAKSKMWLFALIGLLIIGGGIWYFTSNSNSKNATTNDSTVPSAVSANTSSTPSTGQSEVTPKANDTSASAKPENNTASNTTTTPSANTSNNAPSTSNNETVGANANKVSASNTASKPTNNSSNANSTANISKANLNNKIPASFDKASASVSNVDNSLVENIISFLEKNPNSKIAVDGYASSEGDLTLNQQLSQSRADAFKTYLISKGGSENRIVATGKGIDNPIASNDTEEGRQKNRRVEISIQ